MKQISAQSDDVHRKRASLLVHRLSEEIIAKGWKPGDFIGAMGDLSERYGVSVPIVREAVRLMEHMQIGEVRRGPSGGLFVRLPSSEAAAVVLRRFFAYSRVDASELRSARHELLRFATPLAIERITESQILWLRESTRSVAANPLAIIASIGSVARNPGLATCIEALLPDRSHVLLALARSERWRDMNEALAAAVTLGDGFGAMHAIDGMIDLEREIVDLPWSVQESDTPSVRVSLAERVALQLVHTIDARNLAAGNIVGTEEQLTQLLKVSRSTLREGLRILEYHNVAAMRPGPGGGLVVGTPRPDSAVEVASTQLNLMSITPRQIHELRQAVELPSIERTARTLTDQDADQLRSLSTTLREMTPDEVNNLGYRLDLAVADASRNRPLATFVRIATRLQSERVEQFAQDEEEKVQRTRLMAEVHCRIAEAVLARDPAIARHRLRRHLEEIHRFVMPKPALPQHRLSLLEEVAVEEVGSND